MEFQIEREIFLTNLNRIKPFIDKKSNMPILSSVFIETKHDYINIRATDLEIGIQCSNINANIIEEGIITVPGTELHEIVKGAEENIINIKSNQNRVVISYGKTTFELVCFDYMEFPDFAFPENVNQILIDGDTFHEMVSKTVYATMTGEDNSLTGIFMEPILADDKSFLRMVSTDGNRLSLVDKEVEGAESIFNEGKGLMMPRKGMIELSRLVSDGGLLSFGIEKDKNKNVVAKKDKVILTMRLLESYFPDYKSVIPSSFNKIIIIDKNKLIDAIRKMLILIKDSKFFKVVKFVFENNTLKLISTNPDKGEGEENIPINYEMEKLEIGFNPNFLIDVLQSMESSNIEINLIDNMKPCLIKGDADRGFLGLIMPVKC